MSTADSWRGSWNATISFIQSFRLINYFAALRLIAATFTGSAAGANFANVLLTSVSSAGVYTHLGFRRSASRGLRALALVRFLTGGCTIGAGAVRNIAMMMSSNLTR